MQFWFLWSARLILSLVQFINRVESRGGRIHKLKDPKPLRIQQEEIWIRSGPATFSILRSGFASKQPDSIYNKKDQT